MMNWLTFLFLLCLSFYHATAQVKAFAPLPCSTWGPDQYLSYEEVQRIAAPDPLGKYMAVTSTSSAARYETFGKDRNVYSWLPDTDHYSYINNVQVIRWNIVDKETVFKFIVKNIFDDELYSVSSENSCGVIIFPDSIQTQNNIVFIAIKPQDIDFSDQLKVINFSHVELHPRKKEERLAILDQIKACSTLECKIEKLKAYNAILDMLSLLELEKMKDRQNKTIDKLYWEIVSQIRYKYSYRSWER